MKTSEETSIPTGLDRIKGLMAWWGMSNVLEAGQIEAQGIGFKFSWSTWSSSATRRPPTRLGRDLLRTSGVHVNVKGTVTLIGNLQAK